MKGFIHFAPLFVIAFLSFGVLALSTNTTRSTSTPAVLSDEDVQRGSSVGQAGRQTTDIKPLSSPSAPLEKRIAPTRETSIKVRPSLNTEKERLLFPTKNTRVGIDSLEGTSRIKFENAQGEEVVGELKEGDSLDVEGSTEELSSVSLKTRGSDFLFKQADVNTKTKFPLSIDLATNELIVTTPAGVKRVAVLPQKAIENMIRVGHVDVISAEPPTDPSASISPTPLASIDPLASPIPSVSPTPEGTSSESSNLEIVEENGDLLYVAEGFKRKRLFGLFGVLVPKKVKISAQSGEVVDVDQTISSTILDIFSF